MEHIQLTGTEMERLQAELAELEGPKRREIVEAIAVARGFGDLSENFEYHAAKNEQGLLARQIVLLRARIASARVIDTPAEAARLHTGSRVTLADESGDRFEVVVSAAGGPGTCSPDSPLGRAIRGAAIGERVAV